MRSTYSWEENYEYGAYVGVAKEIVAVSITCIEFDLVSIQFFFLYLNRDLKNGYLHRIGDNMRIDVN